MTLLQNKQYLVQIFEHCYGGQHFIDEKVVLGDEGIHNYLKEHTFNDRIINEVIINRHYETSIDLILIKEQESDGSFDSYCEL